MALKDILNAPQLYQSFQEWGGFFGARVKGIERYLKPKAGQKIIDIGCGPGHIVRHLPDGIDYKGFDIDQGYIDFANRTFGSKGTFYCRFFDDDAAREFGPADIVMMNGVLHHIPDKELASTLASVARALKPDGRLFTLDGVFLKEQSKFVRRMLENDRGRFVRTPEAYTTLLRRSFGTVDGHVHNDFSRVPYSFFIAISSKPQQGSAV